MPSVGGSENLSDLSLEDTCCVPDEMGMVGEQFENWSGITLMSVILTSLPSWSQYGYHSSRHHAAIRVHLKKENVEDFLYD